MYAGGRMLAVLMWLALLGSLPWLNSPGWGPPHLSLPQFYLLLAVVVAGSAVAVVIHELGHLVTALALGVKVRGFRIGAEDKAFVRGSVRGLRLVIGSPFHGGGVNYAGRPSAGRRVAVTFAGPLADVIVAGVLVAIPFPVTHALAATIALVGLTNLLPIRTRAGQLSDGARLLAIWADTRAQKAVAELLKSGHDEDADRVKLILARYRKGDRRIRGNIGRIAGLLRKEGRTAELLEVHRGLGDPPERMSSAQAAALVQATAWLSSLAELSDDDTKVADRRLGALLRNHDLDQWTRASARYSMAMLRLRRGRYADVEPLCRSAMAGMRDALPVCEMALAMVIIAREALQQPSAEVYAEAKALRLDVAAAMEGARLIADSRQARGWLADLKEFQANPDGPPQPERTDRLLAAYRGGHPMIRIGVGHIGHMLRDEGRTAELLELHAGLPLPSGPRHAPLMHAMAHLEDAVAYVPGLPAQAYELAGTRMQWLLDNYPFEGQNGPLRQASMRHTLAVVRLRQGRPAEVEPLCADSLAVTSLPAAARAQVLATIVLARRAQGQPCEDLLAQAIALAPDDYLVKQAAAAGQPVSADDPA